MKNHFETLFLDALQDLEISILLLKKQLEKACANNYSKEAVIQSKQLEKILGELASAIITQKKLILNSNYNPAIVAGCVSQIKAMVDTDMMITLLRFENLLPLINNKEEVNRFLKNRKSIIQNLTSLIYEKDNIILGNSDVVNNLIPFKKPIRKGHLTLIKS
jgi:hypothetical protein